MAGRFDLLRSYVRSAARAGAERVGKLSAVENARQAFEELKLRRATLTETALSRAIANGPGVVATTVSIRDSVLRVDMSSDDGAALRFSVKPDAVRFAPRGAKEVIFIVEPPEAVQDVRVRDAVGFIAAAIARALWAPVLRGARPDEQALIEREGARLRADLRTVPAVRAVLEGSPLAMALEMLTIDGFELEERTLKVRIGLPLPAFR